MFPVTQQTLTASLPQPEEEKPISICLQRLRTRLHALLTAVEGEGRAVFNDMISRNDRRELHRFVSMLTSETNYFFEIINDKEGSRRVKKLLGKSQETDEIFLNAMVNRFIDVMTGKYSYLVALRAINVFNDLKSSVLVNLTPRRALLSE